MTWLTRWMPTLGVTIGLTAGLAPAAAAQAADKPLRLIVPTPAGGLRMPPRASGPRPIPGARTRTW